MSNPYGPAPEGETLEQLKARLQQENEEMERIMADPATKMKMRCEAARKKIEAILRSECHNAKFNPQFLESIRDQILTRGFVSYPQTRAINRIAQSYRIGWICPEG